LQSRTEYPRRGHKVTLLVALYLAQGLPFGFFTLALPTLLRQAGYSLKALSALSLLYLPWALKFLWAPYLDHRGTRRGWLLLLQASAFVIALLLTQAQPDGNFGVLLVAAFAFNLIAATQDIVTDGLAVRMLDTRERGYGNAIQVGAYRLGMILGGGVLLKIFAHTNWTVMFTCMAAMLLLTILPVLPFREPAREALAPRPGTAQLAIGWLQRLMMPGMLAFAGLVFSYRFGDQMITALLPPFLTDYGLSTDTIGTMKGIVGSATSLVGALIGGWFAFRSSRRTTLLVSGVGQAAAFTFYILASMHVGGVNLLWTATIVEGVIGTMATVALFTLMMDASDPEHAGTDYTVLASIVVLVNAAANFCSAAIADAFGYTLAFTIGAVLALLGCLLVVWVLDRKAITPRVAEAWAMRR
jgi:MFS family permease